MWTFRYRNRAFKQCRINIGLYSSELGLAQARTRTYRLTRGGRSMILAHPFEAARWLRDRT